MVDEIRVVPRTDSYRVMGSALNIAAPESVREKELLGYVRLARLNLPFFHMHPCRKIDPHTELSMDLDQSVIWAEELRAQSFKVLEGVWVEFIQDPRWELNLVGRTLELAKQKGFTEVEFYEAYAKHIVMNGTSVYANAVLLMKLFREERLVTHRDYRKVS